MSTTNLFLGVTGSVATRTVGTIIEHAHRNGFEQVIFHPTISALPFLVETILYYFPEIHHQISIKKYTDELCSKIEKGETLSHGMIQTWFLGIREYIPEVSEQRRIYFLGILDSYEAGEEQGGIQSRTKGDIKHIEIARKSQVALIAPATANTIAKIVNGITDTFLLQVIRAIDDSGNTPVFIAPAMNTQMLHDPFTKRNFTFLETEGRPKYHILPTVEKVLQC